MHIGGYQEINPFSHKNEQLKMDRIRLDMH